MYKTLHFFIFYINLILISSCSTNTDWRTANRDSINIVPTAEDINEEKFYILYARAFSWRGYFGIHPWITWLEKDSESFKVAQILGWRLRHQGKSSLVVTSDLPDRRWFDNDPKILFEARGEEASKIISQVKGLIESYPHTHKYRLWPGPNSNTFVDYIIRNVAEIKVELPPHAIGKDFPTKYTIVTPSPSATGLQLSLYGVFGLTVGIAEGIELNTLGLNFGIDFWIPAIKLPFIGRIGFPDKSL